MEVRNNISRDQVVSVLVQWYLFSDSEIRMIIGLGYTAEVLCTQYLGCCQAQQIPLLLLILMENPWQRSCGYNILLVTCTYLAFTTY
jgi:hypothetical protein